MVTLPIRNRGQYKALLLNPDLAFLSKNGLFCLFFLMIENLSNKISEILNKRFPIFKGTHVSWSDMLSDIHVSRSDLSPGNHVTVSSFKFSNYRLSIFQGEANHLASLFQGQENVLLPGIHVSRSRALSSDSREDRDDP